MNDILRSHFGLNHRQLGTGAAYSCLVPPKACETFRCTSHPISQPCHCYLSESFGASSLLCAMPPMLSYRSRCSRAQ